MWCEAKGASNPSVLTAERFGDKKGVDIAIKTQQSNSLCFAVNPPPFDKGGKGVGDFRGIIVFLQLLWEWQYSVQREEQARQGCLSVCAQVLCKDAKPTKHTQTLILRKAKGIVRFLEGLVRQSLQ